MTDAALQAASLEGAIAPVGVLVGALEGAGRIEAVIEADKSALAPAYRGPYRAVPMAEPQVLATEGLRMVEDVEVAAIPLARVGNDSDGYTVTIG